MTSATRILEFGHDAELLRTRGWVLRTCGYRVDSTTRLSDLQGMLCDGSVALLVLCHTLPWRVCQAAQEIAGAQTPPVDCLVLLAGDRACSMLPATKTVETAQGPTKLLLAVASIVDNNQTSYSPLQPSGGRRWHS